MERLNFKSDELYNQIVRTYALTGSVKATAERLNTYPIKVRRVLITEGLWESETSRSVGALHRQGHSAGEIAKRLFLSEKNVQSYLPYTRGAYTKDVKTADGIRSKDYRERMKHAFETQVKKRMEKVRDESSLSESKGTKEGEERMRNTNDTPYAIKLHLELDMTHVDKEELAILKKYGKMKKGFIREFVVPGDMTLHALHYAINRAFGWQNSHLHSFHPGEEEFSIMTGGQEFKQWIPLSGVYFRFPSEDYEDLYWDDDYQEGQSFKSWLRKKYKGPYEYGGTLELHDQCQSEIKRLTGRFPLLEVRSSFMEWMEEQKALDEDVIGTRPEPDKIKKVIPIRDATIGELESSISFGGGFDEILERLPLCDVLLQPSADFSWEDWHLWRKGLSDRSKPRPCFSSIAYHYDYGDGWVVNITCTDVWHTQEEFEQTAYDSKALNAHRPTCISADGMFLLDDVGGIHGFCDFLETVNEGTPEERREMRDWASIFGWTGRSVKPENIL